MKLRFALAALALLGASCGDDPPPEASPVQADAIANLIDANLAPDEQRCVLEGLIDSGVEPESIVDGSVSGEEDAELLAVAAACIEDLSAIPAFVQSFIDGAAEEGTVLSEAEAVCAIQSLEAADVSAAIVECLGASDEPESTGFGYGDDATLDLFWDACDDGNAQVCDDLFEAAPLGSDYLEFARTCGDRLPESTGLRCFEELG